MPTTPDNLGMPTNSFIERKIAQFKNEFPNDEGLYQTESGWRFKADPKRMESFIRTLHSEWVEIVRGEIEKNIEHYKKLHDENMPHNTLIAYHADSSIRALSDILSLDILKK